jgi:archaellum component FlaC
MNELGNIRRENHEILSATATIKSDVNNLKDDKKNIHKSISSLSSTLNIFEQERVNSQMEISGVSKEMIAKNKNNLIELVGSLINSYKIIFDRNSVKKAFSKEINTKQGKKSLIIVDFFDKTAKEKIVKAKRENDKEKTPTIFFSHVITPHTRKVFNSAREKKRDAGMDHVFIVNGQVYMRKEGAERGICVKTLADIDRLIEENKKNIQQDSIENSDSTDTTGAQSVVTKQ